MQKKRQKYKVVTKNKCYPLVDCALYKLRSKRRLAEILFSSPTEIRTLCLDNNYRCFVDKSGTKPRNIQEPTGQLDRIHSRIASLLCRIETFDGLHSGKKGYSNITNALAHVGADRHMVTVDLNSFFPSTQRRMVFDFFFDTMKCAPDVADLLSDLLTFNNHLPTGSRISMPLAYFANKKMFDEMRVMAEKIEAVMTIYVDDITVSGANVRRGLIFKLGQIAKKYGHNLKGNKSRYFDKNEIKLVTGAAIRNTEISPRNKHLEKLHKCINAWELTENAEEKTKAAHSVLGRFNYAGSIDARYKDRARSFRKSAFG